MVAFALNLPPGKVNWTIPACSPGRLRSIRFARRDRCDFESHGFREILAVAVMQCQNADRAVTRRFLS